LSDKKISIIAMLHFNVIVRQVMALSLERRNLFSPPNSWKCGGRGSTMHRPANILGFFGGKIKHQVFSPAAADET
jgi:hypothetical protein